MGGEIPVLIGKGLSKTYPVGSAIKMEESVLGRPITLRVQGVLLIVITGLSIWNALVSVRLMLKDFTINRLVGLSDAGLKKYVMDILGCFPLSI